MNKIIVNAGDIFCIPLFMPKDDWKLKIKLSDKDLDKKIIYYDSKLDLDKIKRDMEAKGMKVTEEVVYFEIEE